MSFNFLVGYKTYIVAASIVAGAIASLASGEADLATAVNQALTGLGLATLRSAVK